jgi:hypothetical protein
MPLCPFCNSLISDRIKECPICKNDEVFHADKIFYDEEVNSNNENSIKTEIHTNNRQIEEFNNQL